MIWEPSQAFIESTNVWRFMQRLGFSDREQFLLFSREQPERFWDEVMREMRVEWFEPYRKVMDASRGVEWAQWYVGGRLIPLLERRGGRLRCLARDPEAMRPRACRTTEVVRGDARTPAASA